MNARFLKAYAHFVTRPQIIFFIFFAKRTQIHIKNGAFKAIPGMFFGNHGVLYGVHAANRRAVAIPAFIIIAGTDALKPGDFFRFLFI